jgi:hypothetical protein
MWYDRKFVRLLLIIGPYLLGALGATILRFVAEPASFHTTSLMVLLYSVITMWFAAAAFLPWGTMYYLGNIWGQVVGFLTAGVLVVLVIWILVARARGALILAYGIFVALVVVLARGCAYAEIDLP